MASSNTLFDLIHSLTSNEKRHFRLHSSIQKNEKAYLKLFDLLENAVNYNREQIIKQLKGSVTDKDLHVTENYLYKKLMESLRTFYTKNSIDTKINNLLLEANILKSKGFYKLEAEVLRKAEKLAIKYHKHTTLLAILPQKATTIITSNPKNLIKEVEQAYQEAYTLVHKIEQEIEYRHRNIQLVASFRKWRTLKNEPTIQNIKESYSKTIAKGFPTEGSFYSQYYYYSIQAIYAHLHQEYLQAKKFQQEVVHIWDQFSLIRKANLQLYITQLANLINYAALSQEYDEALLIIQKLAALKTTTFDEEGEQFQNIYFYQQGIYLNTGKYAASRDLIPQIEAGLLKFEKKISTARKLNFYYNSTVTFFLIEDYQAAADWLNQILNITRTNEHRKDIQRFARILQLAIYYKLSSTEVLEYMFRGVYRDKKLKDQMIDFEKILLTYFKKLIYIIPNSREERNTFKELYLELDQLDTLNKKTLGYEEFYIWVQMMCKTNS
jgi:hypothetical protein